MDNHQLIDPRDARSVLVTGGSGFVGRAVCEELLGQGWRVTVGVRTARPDLPHGVGQLVLGDLASFHRGMDLSQFFAVVHLAAQVHLMAPTPQQLEEFEVANARATGELAHAAVASGVSRFVFMSSVKVNGEASSPGNPLVESNTAHPLDAYGRSKLQAEYLIAEAAESSGMEWVVLRPPLVYGQGVKANFRQLVRIAGLPVPLPFGAIRNKRSLVYVGNLAHAVAFALSSDGANGGTFFVRDGRDLSTGDLTARIRKSAGRRFDFQLPVPTTMLRRLASLVGQQSVVDRLTDSLQVDDSELRSLGWRPPYSVDQGLAQTVGGRTVRPRLLFLVTEDWYFCSHRMSVARAARDAGWEVHVACRVNAHGEQIQSEGFVLHPLRLSRSSTNPLGELAAIAEIRQIHRRVDPEIAHHVALKPVLYGGVAARRRGGPQVVNAIAGMGSIFSGGQGSSPAKSAVLQMGFRFALRGDGRWLVVQNDDDLKFFRSRRLIEADRAYVIPGSGVDTELFSPDTVKAEAFDRNRPIRVTIVARMLWDKGIGEAVEAVRLLTERETPVELWLVGDPDPENPNSIDEHQLMEWDKRPEVVWWGRRDDIPGVWAQSDIALLPSYREGMPRSLLEAGASGLPLIATHVPGCDALVKDGLTGLLVPPRDPIELAEAVERLFRDPSLRLSMGAAARADVVAAYSDDQILGQFLNLYDQISGKGGPRYLDLRENSPRSLVQPARSVRSSV